MRVSHWFRPPQHILVLFLAVMLTLAGTLGWLGWRLFDQDRALERERLRDHLESIADLASGALIRGLAETEEQLAKLAALPEAELALAVGTASEGLADDGALVLIGGNGIDVHSPGGLSYSPMEPGAPRDAGTFAAGEALEFQQQDFALAIDAFRRLSQSPDAAVRGGALLRLARNLRKAHQPDAALTAYDELIRLGSTRVDSTPAELLGRHARCTMFEQLNRPADLLREAQALEAALVSGRWRVTRAAYRYYREESRRFLGDTERASAESDAREQQALALSEGVESLWNDWLTRGADLAGAGRRAMWLQDRSVLLLWRGIPQRVVALVAGPRHLAKLWLNGLQPLLDREDVQLGLTDSNGRLVSGPAMEKAPQRVLRAATETRLPWSLHVISRDRNGHVGALTARRRLLLTGLATMGVFVLVGSALIARAITRELEAARVQKDFMSAVSHEFRTPLASMMQLSELLVDGRVSTEARRRQYYDRLQRESGRLHRLVETWLDFGRMEAGAREYRFETIDAGALVRAVGDEFTQKVMHLGYQVDMTIEEALPHIRADREAVNLALWNLLDNAVKYSPESKTIWVDTAREDGCVAIRVRDRGLGIDAADQKRIFNKFVRTASAAGVKGTGLGLAMVHHILMAHGGKIRLESQPGSGSAFTMLLPAEKV